MQRRNAPTKPGPSKRCSRRRCEIVTDLARRFETLPRGVWPEPPHTAVVLPIVKAAGTFPRRFLVAGIARRALDEQYHAFLDLVANQIATAIANARAHEEERRRSQALTELDRAKTAFFSNVSHEFHLAHGHARPGRGAAGEASHRPVARRGQASRRGQPQRLDCCGWSTPCSTSHASKPAGRAPRSSPPTSPPSPAELASVFRPPSSAPSAAAGRLSEAREPVFVDRDMWEKVVLNLLSNAFKFTFDGEIEVSLRRPEPRKSSCACATPHRDSSRGDGPAVRAVPPRREGAGAHARRQRDRARAGAGAGQAPRRHGHGGEPDRRRHHLHRHPGAGIAPPSRRPDRRGTRAGLQR